MATIKLSALALIAAASITDVDRLPITDMDGAPATTYAVQIGQLRTALSTPSTDGGNALGTAAKRWSDLRAQQATLSGLLTITAGGLTVSAGTSALQGVTATTLQTSGIAGFGQAPEANNAVAARGATNDNTSNILLGRNAAGTTKFAVDSSGTITALGSATISGNIILTGFYASSGITLGFIGGSTDTQFKNSANNAANLTISDAGAITVRNGLTVSAGGLTVSAGDTQLGAGVRQTGTVVARFENSAITRPTGSAGVGLELGASLIQSYNSTSAAFAPIQFNASSFTFANGGVTVSTGGITVSAGGASITGGLTLAGTGVALTFGNPSTRATIGANGGASALTANPLGYLDAVINGVNVQFPYYSRGA